MADFDPATNRLYRDKWEQWERVLQPQSLDYDALKKATNEDPAANATTDEITTLITTLEAVYRELGEKLKALKREHPLAQMPNESDVKYYKRVPEARTFSVEEKWALVWPTNDRRDVGRAIKALRDGHPPCHLHGNRNETTYALLRPFMDRWGKVYRAKHDVEHARMCAITAATLVDDEAWEKYQLHCDYRDAKKQVDAEWGVECDQLRGGLPPAGISASTIHDMLHERALQRVPEITRARHARERSREAAE